MDERTAPSLAVPGAIPNVGDGLTRYYNEIKKFPLLDAEEEFVLAKKWAQDRDPEAAEKLVNAHLRLVAKIAHGYKGYGLPIADLISEGNVGLVQALGKYDPDRGFRFSTYAMWWIKAAIQEHILHSWSLVKIGTTGAQKKLFFNLRRIKGEIQKADEFHLSDDHIDQIATQLNVSHHEVVHMNRRLAGQDHSLNALVGGVEEGGEWQDWLMDERQNQEARVVEQDSQHKMSRLLEESLKCLNAREMTIIQKRRLKEPPDTLEVLSEELHLSRERIRQIEGEAFQKLQKAVKILATQKKMSESDHPTLF